MQRTNNFQLAFPDPETIASWKSSRAGETRLGEKVFFRIENNDDWKRRRFHVLGIRESIGPQANGGFGGAEKGFDTFIKRFLAVQSNRFLSGLEIAVHGTIDPLGKPAGDLSAWVTELDELVAGWTQEVIAAGGIPVVIGGGHNNAYGLIKGAARAAGTGISVVNLDPHADTRELEGRHSGNPFSYAFEEGHLKHYTVLGLHQSYNNEAILQRLDQMQAVTAFFEQWIDEPARFHHDVLATVEHHEDAITGLELDMDAIAFMPSSAFTPSGITLEQARYYIRKMATIEKISYLHLPEAAPQSPEDEAVVGKALTYLVTDFIKQASANQIKK